MKGWEGGTYDVIFPYKDEIARFESSPVLLYFTDKLESSKSNPKKTWQLINELSSRHPNKVRNIAEIKVREQTITESSDIAEELNLHFSSVGEKLASEIPSSNV